MSTHEESLSGGVVNLADRSELVTRYQRMRVVGRELNHELVRRLPTGVLREGARRLGILRGNTFVFDSEDESAVLMDYCIYDVRTTGRNAIEQYLIDSPPDPDSDEMLCLRAMQHATYSLFLVESVERGVGITVQDLLGDDTILIVDMGLAATAVPGLVFASRLLFHDGFAMTGGAALPVSVLPLAGRDAIVAKFAKALTGDPASLIRACLGRGCSSQIEYQEPFLRGQLPSAPGSGLVRVSRNAPCPCGSGKKFKNCCLKRR